MSVRRAADCSTAWTGCPPGQGWPPDSGVQVEPVQSFADLLRQSVRIAGLELVRPVQLRVFVGLLVVQTSHLMREAGPLASLVKGSAAAAAGGSALVLPDHPFEEVYWQIVRPPVRRRPNC